MGPPCSQLGRALGEGSRLDGGDNTGRVPRARCPPAVQCHPPAVFGALQSLWPAQDKRHKPHRSAPGASPGDGAVPIPRGVAGSAQGHLGLGGLGCQARTGSLAPPSPHGISPAPKWLLVGSPKPKSCRSTWSGSIQPAPSRSPSRFPLGKINGQQEPAGITWLPLLHPEWGQNLPGCHRSWQHWNAAFGLAGDQRGRRQEGLAGTLQAGRGSGSRDQQGKIPHSTTEGKLRAKGTLLLTLLELFFSPWHVSVKNSLGF